MDFEYTGSVEDSQALRNYLEEISLFIEGLKRVYDDQM